MSENEDPKKPNFWENPDFDTGTLRPSFFSGITGKRENVNGGRLKPGDTVIMPKSIEEEITPYLSAFPAQIVFSAHVNHDKAYVIPKREVVFSTAMASAKIEVDVEDLRAAMDRVWRRIEYDMHRQVWHYGADPAAAPWQRNRGESVLEWGNRLSRTGLLDFPHIRWEYQKAVLKVPVNLLKHLLAKLNLYG